MITHCLLLLLSFTGLEGSVLTVPHDKPIELGVRPYHQVSGHDDIKPHHQVSSNDGPSSRPVYQEEVPSELGAELLFGAELLSGLLELSEQEDGLPSLYNYDNITPNNRTLCPETTDNRPPNRVDTASRVVALQNEMTTKGLDAYIVVNGDSHLSTTDYDQRVAYMSGLSGSGYSVVTTNKAATWTDGRYFLQADQQMDCGWILMQQGVAGYPSSAPVWLATELTSGSKVGADATRMSISTWQSYESYLAASGITLIAEDTDLVDLVWTTDRPEQQNNAIFVHTIDYTGRMWQDKATEVRSQMTTEGTDVLLLTALDDTAWFLNLRGNDKPTSALFDSYASITQSQITLYLRNFQTLIAGEAFRSHLNVNEDGTCSGRTGECVMVKEYGTFESDVAVLAESLSVSAIWLSPEANYAIYRTVGDKRHLKASPIQLMKSVKNSVERRRYYECQVRDSAAVVEFAAFIEKEVQAGNTWTELSAAERLTEIRKEDPSIRAPYVSFSPISAVGPNAAVIHYRPTPETDKQITTDDVYLLDSGGQYLDGTTDVTRTFHFGNPPDKVKEAYTRVLIGVIDLASTVWPTGLYGSDIDAITRSSLWKNGWDYRHGTGHGIGYFLNVHEGPGRINLGYSSSHAPLTEGMFFSDEPGYYEPDEFGIRLESIVGVVKANTPNNFGGQGYLTFNAATLVPFEKNLIKYDMLEVKHRQWLNQYHRRCEVETGKYLKDQAKEEAYQWILARTARIPEVPVWVDDINSGSTVKTSMSLIITFFTSVYFLSRSIHL